MMHWIIGERFNRSFAYHYHKKAARRAVYDYVADDEDNNENNNENATTTLLLLLPQPTMMMMMMMPIHVVYQRQVIKTMRHATGLNCLAFANQQEFMHDDEDVHNYQARLVLNLSNSDDDDDATVRVVTGRGVEICTDDADDDKDDEKDKSSVPLLSGQQQEESFTITGRLSLRTGRFYWIEERSRREKHLVMGTLQPSYWNEQQQQQSTFISEDAMYVKRRDVDRCGIPLDGDIRETILSLTTTVVVRVIIMVLVGYWTSGIIFFVYYLIYESFCLCLR